jgi:regulator of protease activity HflC (stomatin/prohibitin superfamily)
MEWLTRLIDRLLSIFPRLVIVAPDEIGVRYTPGIVKGIHVISLIPGWWLYWPLIQNIVTVPCKTQVKDLRPQSVWTSDRVEMTVSGAIRYRVRSAQKALLEVYDYDQNIQAVALGIIQQYIREHELQNLNTQRIEQEVLKGVREASAGWGLYIEKVYITDIGRTWNIRLLMNESILGE